jgi:electron transport complex protein RnfB
MTAVRIDAIDALLPQTQCGKCGHPACRPYAEGIAAGEAINKCPPGGDETVAALAELLHRDPIPLELPPVPPQVAFIREAECIGCTKCIQACPVDAILGAAKRMHTVIHDECSGCELCVAPCPVDCIDIVPLPAAQAQAQRQRAGLFRRRHEARQARLALTEARRQADRAARPRQAMVTDPASARPESPSATKIEAARLRMALSRAQKQLARRGTAELEAQVASLLAAAAGLSASEPPPTANREREIDAAKVAAALARSQLAKARKAFGANPDAGQHDRLRTLESAAERAEQQLGLLQSGPAPDLPDLRQAKIALVARRAELRSAERQGAGENRLAELRAALEQAERWLHAAEAASDRPEPLRTRQPVADPRRRELKTELAHARAALSKLQRRTPDDHAAIADASTRLAEAQRQLDAYEHAHP